MARLPDQIVNQPPSPGHIEWGNPFQIPSALIEHAVGDRLEIQPEIASLSDENGGPLTLQVVFHIQPPLEHPETGEKVNTIALGSFGQSDPVRMYFTSIYTAAIINMPGFLDDGIEYAQNAYGEGAKIRLDELFYTCLNTSFFAKPGSSYRGSHYDLIKWTDLPDSVMAEIDKRVRGNAPLNYQYLAHAIEQKRMPQLVVADFAAAIKARADAEQERSTAHKLAHARGEFDYGVNDIYDDLASALQFVDFEISFEGVSVVDSRVFNWLNVTPRPEPHLISDNPAVNAAHIVIDNILNLVGFYLPGYGVETQTLKRGRLPLVGDHIRRELTLRIYKAFVDRGLVTMSLGHFASEVYQLRLNNSDSNLMEFLERRDDSQVRLAALGKEN